MIQRLLFQHEYNDGLRQYRILQRDDGTKVVINSFTKPHQIPDHRPSHLLSQLEVISYARAATDITRHNEVLEEHQLTNELNQKLNVEPEGEGQAPDSSLTEGFKNLSPEEKRKMLEQLEALAKVPTTEGGEPSQIEQYKEKAALGELLLQAEGSLVRHRKRYVKTVLPITGIFDSDEMYLNKKQDRTEAYEEAIYNLLDALESAPEEADKFIVSEQARRLALFNRQLKLRTRIKMVGTTAVGAAVALIPLGTGIGVGEAHLMGATPTEGIIGGAVVATGFVAKYFRTAYKRFRMLAPFVPDTTAPEQATVSEQITAEIKLAGLNSHDLNNFDVD
jgi:hypothetical protein